jgi:hypothetical protein
MREHQTRLTRVDPDRTRPVRSPIVERVGSQGGCAQERIGRLSEGASNRSWHETTGMAETYYLVIALITKDYLADMGSSDPSEELFSGSSL